MKPSFDPPDRKAKNAEKQQFASAVGERLRKIRKEKKSQPRGVVGKSWVLQDIR